MLLIGELVLVGFGVVSVYGYCVAYAFNELSFTNSDGAGNFL